MVTGTQASASFGETVWKDGKYVGHEINISAQLTLTVSADGVSVPALLFIQLESNLFEPGISAPESLLRAATREKSLFL